LVDPWVEEHKSFVEQKFIDLGRPRKKGDVTRDQNARTKACTRLDFHGALEETPPDAGAADPKVNMGNIFSPNTLHKVVTGGDQLATDCGE
jgi:hypothetical protein